MAPPVRGACCIVSAVGVEDEVSAAAKEILSLIEDHGYDPMEVGSLDTFIGVMTDLRDRRPDEAAPLPRRPSGRW